MKKINIFFHRQISIFVSFNGYIIIFFHISCGYDLEHLLYEQNRIIDYYSFMINQKSKSTEVIVQA